jgi:hypothetical protein
MNRLRCQSTECKDRDESDSKDETENRTALWHNALGVASAYYGVVTVDLDIRGHAQLFGGDSMLCHD